VDREKRSGGERGKESSLGRVKPLLVYLTASSEEEARQIAAALVNERLAACVQLLHGLESHYIWQGKATVSREVLLLIKTSAETWEDLRRRVKELHSYECPELVAVTPEFVDETYFQWWRDILARPA
jgi:periplasmic divalent cation tolerance protein